jgi:hypothetical protein
MPQDGEGTQDCRISFVEASQTTLDEQARENETLSFSRFCAS